LKCEGCDSFFSESEMQQQKTGMHKLDKFTTSELEHKFKEHGIVCEHCVEMYIGEKKLHVHTTHMQKACAKPRLHGLVHEELVRGKFLYPSLFKKTEKGNSYLTFRAVLGKQKRLFRNTSEHEY